jgi:hypothetical protein
MDGWQLGAKQGIQAGGLRPCAGATNLVLPAHLCSQLNRQGEERYVSHFCCYSALVSPEGSYMAGLSDGLMVGFVFYI